MYEHTRRRGISPAERLPLIKIGKYVRSQASAVRPFLEKKCGAMYGSGSVLTCSQERKATWSLRRGKKRLAPSRRSRAGEVSVEESRGAVRLADYYNMCNNT